MKIIQHWHLPLVLLQLFLLSSPNLHCTNEIGHIMTAEVFQELQHSGNTHAYLQDSYPGIYQKLEVRETESSGKILRAAFTQVHPAVKVNNSKNYITVFLLQEHRQELLYPFHTFW